jgi:integrase
MYKLNFYLKGLKKSDNEISNNRKLLPIIISISFKSQRIVLSTGKKIHLNKWDRSRQEPKLTKDASDNEKQLKSEVLKLKSDLDAFLLSVDRNRTLSKEDFVSVIKQEVKTVPSTIKDVVDHFLGNHKTKDGHPLKKNTRKKYHSLGVLLREFSKKDLIVLSQIDTRFVERFKSFLLEDKNHTDNTVCKYVKALRTLTTQICSLEGVKPKADFDKVKVSEQLPAIHILTLEEVKQILNYQPANVAIEQIKDLFLFQCFTGQRYSDIETLKWENIVEVSHGKFNWNLSTTKTNQTVSVPLNDEAQAIINKYIGCGKPLPRVTNQNANRMLKKLAVEAQLERVIELIVFRNGEKFKKAVPLKEKISTHMARKTFISLSLQMGVPERGIKEVSGHRDDKSFNRYVQLNNFYHQSLLDAWNNNIKLKSQ